MHGFSGARRSWLRSSLSRSSRRCRRRPARPAATTRSRRSSRTSPAPPRSPTRTSSTAGASRAARRALVGRRQRHAASRRSTPGTARCRRSPSTSLGGPTGVVVRRDRRQVPDRDDGEHDARARELHLRERGRDDPRVARRLDGRARRRRRASPRRDLQGARDRAPATATAALRGRLPQRARRRLRRRLAARSRRPARSSTRTCRPATRRSGSRRSAARIFVTYAKQDADAEDEVAGQGLGFVDVYDLHGQPGRARRAARPAERAVGPGAGAGRASAASRRPARRQLRRRPDQRLRERQRRLAARRHAARARRRQARRSTGCGRSSSATPAANGDAEHALLHRRARTTSPTGCSARSRPADFRARNAPTEAVSRQPRRGLYIDGH